jgi:hypothetical protein
VRAKSTRRSYWTHWTDRYKPAGVDRADGPHERAR